MLQLFRFSLVATCLLSLASPAHAAKPEDVFKGRIIITANRLPTRFASQGAFISALKSQNIDKVWPKEEKGNDHAVWKLEYIAFFATPLNDNEITVKFWETFPERHYVAGDEQYIRERGSRIFASSIELAKPDFETNKKYSMTIERGGRVLARTEFWLRGKGANYSGKVEFTDEEAKAR